MKLFARGRWPRVEGRVIDKRHIKKFLAKFDSSSVMVSVDEYMVEYTRSDGRRGRVAVKAQSVRLPLQGVHVGQTVPVHVNRKGTQAVFGDFEPAERRAEQKRRERQQRAADEERFRRHLEET